MDKATQTYIEQAIGINIGSQTSRGVFEYTGAISEVVLDDLARNDYAALEWQDRESHDCGNGDGVLYVYLPAIEDVGELFIGIDLAEYTISVS